MTVATFQLSDVAELITKGTTPPKSMGGFSDVGVNYLKSESLSYTGAVDTSGLVKVSPEIHQKLKRSQLKDDDILYSIAGANLGKCGIVPSEILPANTNQAVAIIRLDKTKADPRFVSFFLRNPRFVRGVLAGVAQSAQPNVNLADIGRYELPAFNLSEQMAIGDALGAFDDKIELNRQMNETLEEMARALFRDWFVDFGPTRRQMEGATDPTVVMGNAFPAEKAAELAPLFPEKLGEDGLPGGWQKRELRSVLTLHYGKSLPKKMRKPGDFNVYGSGGITGTHETALVKGPSVIVGRKGTVGSLYWSQKDFFAIDTVFYVDSDYPMVFCHRLLETLGLETMNTDAAVPGLNRDNAYRQEFAFGGEKLINVYSEYCNVLAEKREANGEENRTLAEMRDLLLPKLMSGEISLKDAEDVI